MIKICRGFISALRYNDYQNIRKITASALLLDEKSPYKSDLSLDEIYPRSKKQIFNPPPPDNKGDKFSGYIPMDDLVITYCRSSGPGGQHVNVVNSKADVRFKVSTAEWIPEKTRQKMAEGLQNKLTKNGYLIVTSDLTRSQRMNLADALEKLREIIREYEVEKKAPSEESLEMARKRQEKAASERVKVKRQRSQVKADRQDPAE